MKSQFLAVRWLGAIVALLLVTGCNTVSSSYQQAIGGPTYPPSDPTQIQILREAPTRPHVRLGEVRAEPANTSTPVSYIETALRKEAAKLGANAVVIIYDQTQVTGAVVTGPWYGRSIEQIQGRVIVGVAIRYQ